MTHEITSATGALILLVAGFAASLGGGVLFGVLRDGKPRGAKLAGMVDAFTGPLSGVAVAMLVLQLAR
jgi:LDH2 family malate/lactate/ureidoglycolate dehydrogenase